MKDQVTRLCGEIQKRIDDVHIACFGGMDKPLFLICDTYPGVWLEHVYDAVFYAQMVPGRTDIAVNTVRAFLDRQRPDGQLPCYIWDERRQPAVPKDHLVGYGQIQECVSFARLCLLVCRMTGDRALLRDCYAGCARWSAWLERNRMTTGRGLVEQFVGYDTGHDNSGRSEGLACPYGHMENGAPVNAAVPPPPDGISPLLAVDMNCNFYGTQTALSEMAAEVGDDAAAHRYSARAAEVKRAIFDRLFDAHDAFFYDADVNGRHRKYKSCAILHLFMERVLDRKADAPLIRRILEEHLLNLEEFWTPYPFPSMALNDESRERHRTPNSWGYYSQALTALRCTLWMDDYGLQAEFDYLLMQWLTAWTRHYDTHPFGQELHPATGECTPCARWYSSCMLLYLFAAGRLGYAAPH